MQPLQEKLPIGVQTLLLVLGIGFIYEVWQAGSLGFSPGLLARIGATNPALAERDPIFWLRIFTALFLHGNLIHLLFNSIGILIGGPLLERLIGAKWFWFVFLYSGAFGSIYSLFFSKYSSVSIGASGGVMGIFSCALILTNFKVIAKYRKNLNILLFQALIPSLIPVMRGVDYAAHFGGAMAGAALGLLILQFWPNTQAKPNGDDLAQALIVLFATGTAFALYLTVFNF